MSDEIPTDVRDKLLSLQRRCQNPECGSAYGLHIHHRVFKSEGERGLATLLESALPLFEKRTHRSMLPWSLDDIQNLVVVCLNCHEGFKGIHNGNESLRQYFRNSFTHPKTGFNIRL
jgi:hypothetical protein